MRLLDANKVAYEVITFSSDLHSAVEVAEAVGLDPDMVYKTLVVQRPRGKPLLVMVAGDKQIDLHALAASVDEKKLTMASHRDAEALTGLQVGGISALALLNRGFDICLDRAAQGLRHIVVSAGQRGIDLRLAVDDLVRVTGAWWVDVTSGPHPDPPSSQLTGEGAVCPPPRGPTGDASSASVGGTGGLRACKSAYSSSSIRSSNSLPSLSQSGSSLSSCSPNCSKNSNVVP
jgi:Cys-tRNA(Pro)/Cys-tRNA(Cys) deacylase